MKDRDKLSIAILDIQLIFKHASEIGWYELHEISITRCLYLSAVTYGFINQEIKTRSLFSDIYSFSLSNRGPYSEIINEALTYMKVNEILIEDKNKYVMVDEKLNDYMTIPSSEKRDVWISNIIYILGIFGEDKLYDFIFRDPEYITSVKSNRTDGINTDSTNYTIKQLNNFKNKFDEYNKSKINFDPDKRLYLKLYFEFIFSEVLRGEEA